MEPRPPHPAAARVRTAVWAAIALLAAATPARPQPLYQLRTTDLNRVGLSVTNYGFFGNNFVSRAPSCEYPLGSGFEHLSRAGLWVGALAITDTGEVRRVTTGIVDNYQGSNQSIDTEWTPLPGGIAVGSNLPNSRYYKPSAVSELDLVTSYGDRPGHPPQGVNDENHVPLGVRVDQAVYSFSIEPASHFVILHFTLVNEGSLLRDVHVGLYTQLVSGDKNLYSTWPPSSSSGAGSWYYRHYADYVDSLRLAREHFCDGIPPGSVDPELCVNAGRVPYWAGVKFLGVRGDSALVDSTVLARAGARAGFRLWDWSPDDTTRDQDAERAALMAAGVVDPPHVPRGEQYSPIELVSFGPIPLLPAGDTLAVDFALVFGATQADLAEHAAFAQFAFDVGYDLPDPPPSPRLRVEARESELEIFWEAKPESVVDPTSPLPGGRDFQGYRLYLGDERENLRRIAQYDKRDTAGLNTGLDAEELLLEPPDTVITEIQVPDSTGAMQTVLETVIYRYHHRVQGLRDGFKYFVAGTSYDTGDQQILSLESGVSQNKTLAIPGRAAGQRAGNGVAVFPNPYKAQARWDAGTLVRDHYLWFANLPRRCHLAIFTLAGDLVFETDFDGSSYAGEGARGLYDPKRELDLKKPPALSGASYAWNLISRTEQAVATGVYLYAVRDESTGEVQRGKFLVLKSDREGF